MKTMKKYNLGSPKRPQKPKTKTVSKGFKKYNIGPPEKVALTPDTPRSRIWKKIREEAGYKQYEIQDYEPDEEDLKIMEERKKLGIPSPTSYTTFEETITPFMTEALKKKRPTDTIEQVNEEAWSQKSDDPPHPHTTRSRSRSRSKSRSRSRSRGRTYKSRRRS